MNGKSIDCISFYDELEDYFSEFVPFMNENEEYEYNWDDLHSVWVYLYNQDPALIPCFKEIDILATLLMSKLKSFLTKHHCDNYTDALCLMVVFEQKFSELLDYYNEVEND